MATDVTVIYHYENGSWWADSPQVERWTAAAPSLEQLIQLVLDGVSFALEEEQVAITHWPAPDLMDVFAGRTVGARLRVVIADGFQGLIGEAAVPVPNTPPVFA